MQQDVAWENFVPKLLVFMQYVFLFVSLSLWYLGALAQTKVPAQSNPKAMPEERVKVRLDTAKEGHIFNSMIVLLGKDGKPLPSDKYLIRLLIRPDNLNCSTDTVISGPLEPKEPIVNFLKRVNYPNALKNTASCFYQAQGFMAEVSEIYRAQTTPEGKQVDKSIKIIFEPLRFALGSTAYMAKFRKPSAVKASEKPKEKPILEEKVQVRLDTLKGGYTFNNFITLLKDKQVLPADQYIINLKIRSGRRDCQEDSVLSGSLAPREPIINLLRRINYFTYVNNRGSCFYQATGFIAEIRDIYKVSNVPGGDKQVDKGVRVVFQPFSAPLGNAEYVAKINKARTPVKVEPKSMIITHKGDTILAYIDKVVDDYVSYYLKDKADATILNRNVVQEIRYPDGRSEPISEKVIIESEADWEKVTLVTTFRKVNGLVRKGKVKVTDKVKTQEEANQQMKQQAAKLKAHVVFVQSTFVQPKKDKDNLILQGDAYGYK